MTTKARDPSRGVRRSRKGCLRETCKHRRHDGDQNNNQHRSTMYVASGRQGFGAAAYQQKLPMKYPQVHVVSVTVLSQHRYDLQCCSSAQYQQHVLPAGVQLMPASGHEG